MTKEKVEHEIQLGNQADMDLAVKRAQATFEKPKGKPPSKKTLKEFLAGAKAYQNGDWARAVKHLNTAWEGLPNDMNLLILLAHSLVQLGVREQALAVLEKATQQRVPNAELVSVMLQMASEMQMFDIATRLGNILLTLEQNRGSHYVNVASAYKSNEEYDRAIDICKIGLSRFPELPGLWNILAVTVNLRDGEGAGDVFFDEALRLDPNNFQVLNNYARSCMNRNMVEEAISFDQRALAQIPDHPEPNLGLATAYFMVGRIAEAWKHYKYRLDIRRTHHQVQIYTHKVPEWNGQDLSGKTVLIASEQGIGDEVFFGNFLPFLYERAEKLVIGCATRLVPIYKRRFPNAMVCTAADQVRSGYRYRSFPEAEFAMRDGDLHIDYAIQLAEAARYDWQKTEDIKPHPDGFLNPNPDRAKEFKERLDACSSKPKIGLAWRSGNVSGSRRRHYPEVSEFGPLMAFAEHVDFVNLQYTDSTEDLKAIKKQYGVDLITFDDVNMKNDIEANLAIMSNCDLVVSVTSAPAQFALALGTPTIVMAAFKLWWSFGSDRKILNVPDGEIITSDQPCDWKQTLARVAHRVAERMGLEA